MSKHLLISAVAVALGGSLMTSGAAQAANFGDFMNPGKWFGGNDRDDYYGPYGYPGYGYGYPGYGYPGYGYPGYGYGYPGYGYPGYGYPPPAAGSSNQQSNTPPPTPQ